MALQAFMDPSEWFIFKERIQEISASTPSIIGVLAVGSLVQDLRPSISFSENRRSSPMGLAYESIRNPSRRKVFPSEESDLDIWVCTRDTRQSAIGEPLVNQGGVALLEEIASKSLARPGLRWSRKKQSTFSDFYKKPELIQFRL